MSITCPINFDPSIITKLPIFLLYQKTNVSKAELILNCGDAYEILKQYYDDNILRIDENMIAYIQNTNDDDELVKKILLSLFIDQLITIIRICSTKTEQVTQVPVPMQEQVPQVQVPKRPLPKRPLPKIKPYIPPPPIATVTVQADLRRYYAYVPDDLKITIPDDIFDDITTKNILTLRGILRRILDSMLMPPYSSFIDTHNINTHNSYKKFLSDLQGRTYPPLIVGPIILPVKSFHKLYNFLNTAPFTRKQLIVFLVTFYMSLHSLLQHGGNIFDLFYRWKYEKYKLLNLYICGSS